MLHQVVLGFLVTVATSQAQDEFEPLDPFCLQSAKLLICSKYHSGLFEACLKHSGLEMFFFHGETKSVCAGKTLALCVSGDFCKQSQTNPVDTIKIDPVSAILAATTPADDIFAPLTPVTGNFDQIISAPGVRIQRTQMTHTRIPGPVTPVPSNFGQQSSEEKDVSGKFYFSGEKSAFLFSEEDPSEPTGPSGHQIQTTTTQEPSQGRSEWRPTPFSTELGTPMYWAVVALATLVFFLGAAVVVFLIRDARHRGRKEILKEVRTNQDPALLLELNDVKRKVEAMEVAEAAGAAQRGKLVPIVLPMTNRHNVVSEKREEVNSFSNPNYRPELNPFESAYEKQQQQRKVVEKVHTAPEQQQTEVVAEVHAEPKQHQPPAVHANPKRKKQQQPEVVVVAAEVPARPEQQQPLDVVEAKPRFPSALSDIRSKLERIFEPRLVQQQQPEPEAVGVAAKPEKQQQPEQVVADVPQQHQREVVAANGLAKPEKEIIYASLVFRPPQGPKRELVAVAPGQTATIQRSSIRMRRAPPPPILSKPELPFAGVVKGGTLPRPQKLAPAMASNQAASSVALDQAARNAPIERAPPPPPQRKGSLRSLNSLRRKQAIPTRIESKKDFSSEFLTKYGLWDEDECYETYV